MKEIVFLSGKGGTGKTSLCASCIYLEESCTAADYDVEASNLNLLFDLQICDADILTSGQFALINPEICIECRLCENVCRFDAISDLVVQNLECEGCGLCYHICPVSAVSMVPHTVGTLYQGIDNGGNPFHYTAIYPGAGNSGKIVTEIKNQARLLIRDEDFPFLISDGPPGIGCSVIASLTGASLVVMVTEPGISAFDDMKRLWQLLKSRCVPAVIVINKWDLNAEYCRVIETWAASQHIPIAGRIAYSDTIARHIANAVIPASDPELRDDYTKVWKEIVNRVPL